MSQTTLADLLALRLKIHSNGYCPMPLDGKRPMYRGWTCDFIDAARVRELYEERKYDRNTGLRCDGLIVIDNDVLNPSVNKAIRETTVRHFGPTPLMRVGKAPKLISVYQVDGDDFGRRASARYTIDGLDAQVEVLNGSGRQFVAHGIHPDTGQPYHWVGVAPEDVERSKLPSVTYDQIAPFIAECDAIITAAGGVIVSKGCGADGDKRDLKNTKIWHRHEGVIRQLLGILDLRGILLDYNYVETGDRFSAPKAGEGSAPAVRIITGEQDRIERVSSDHGSDPLGRGAGHGFGGALNAVEAIAVLDHNDDYLAAIDALCAEHGIEQPAPGSEFTANPLSPETEEQLAARKALLAELAEAEKPEADDTAPLIYAFGENPYGARRWLVHQMMPETGVALLSGQWGIGKTFTAIELAVCAIFGVPFARHTVDRQCGVLWLAAEGEAEINDRLQAALDAKPELAGRPVPFVWADRFPLLLAHDAVKQFERIIGAARARLDQMGATLGLIILDTMAAGAGWDNENDAAEGQKAMNLLRKIARHYNCLVLAIDHYGKETGSGTRGTTAKEAAADAVLALIGERQPSGKIVKSRMAVRKARGGVAGREYPFDLPACTIGVDAQGRNITTCTVAWTDRAAQSDATVTEKPLEPKQQRWHDALRTVLSVSGKDTGTMDAWFAEGARSGLAEAIEPEDSRSDKKRKRAAFYSARAALVAFKWVDVDGATVRDLRPGQSLADLTT